MLKLSTYPFQTTKSDMKVSDNISTWSLLRWGFIRQEIAWVYNYLPFWLKIINNIKKIIVNRLEEIWAFEIQMSAIWSKEHWEITGRDKMDVLFKLPFSDNRDHFLNPTHEELVTPIMKEFLSSYKDLPVSVFQIQVKFRNEKRAKSGLLRCREFLMKDMYSFHESLEDLDKYYEEVIEAYNKIFNDLWVWEDTFITYASWWTFSKYSHEFQTILPVGEDTIYLDRNKKIALNKEIINDENVKNEFREYNFKEESASELANIFKLWTKFTDPFEVFFTDNNWERKKVYMWCYWIWVSRAMWIIAEKFMDEKWLFWPENIAPYQWYIIPIWEGTEKLTNAIIQKLEDKGNTVIVDDRNIWFWSKVKDADLFWIPRRIIISEKSISNWWFEYKHRKSENSEILSLEQLEKIILP